MESVPSDIKSGSSEDCIREFSVQSTSIESLYSFKESDTSLCKRSEEIFSDLNLKVNKSASSNKKSDICELCSKSFPSKKKK